ncbi:hypothetical protein DNTS_027343, partial [Danionella cerebrum]
MSAEVNKMNEHAQSPDEVQEELVKKKGGCSIIWNWFGFKISDVNQQTVLCRLCRRVVAAKGGNTSNLFNHLKTVHVREYEDCTKMRATDIAQSRAQVNTMNEHAESPDEVQEELVKKKGGSSIIWNWFGFKISDVNQQTVLCRLCRRIVAAKGGNTSNLFNHLKTVHLREYEDCTKMRATDIAQSG